MRVGRIDSSAVELTQGLWDLPPDGIPMMVIDVYSLGRGRSLATRRPVGSGMQLPIVETIPATPLFGRWRAAEHIGAIIADFVHERGIPLGRVDSLYGLLRPPSAEAEHPPHIIPLGNHFGWPRHLLAYLLAIRGQPQIAGASWHPQDELAHVVAKDRSPFDLAVHDVIAARKAHLLQTVLSIPAPPGGLQTSNSPSYSVRQRGNRNERHYQHRR